MEFISLETAMERLLDAAHPIAKPAVDLPLYQAAGRVCAQDVTAQHSQPPFDRSPLDGYALHATDIATASAQAPVVLPVGMQLFAGDAPQRPLAQGEAARIMTGAPIPQGADCVLRQEDTDEGEASVALYKSLRAGQNICLQGEDVMAGDLLARKGEVLSAAHIGVLCAQGYAQVAVTPTVTIGVLATGSELLPMGAPWQAGKIYDANAAYLTARLAALGFAVKTEYVGDNPAEIEAKITEMGTICDAVLTTGGVSVGQKDYLPQVVDALGGEVLFHGLKLKPGSPMLAARWGEKLLLCLSGNPFAAAATLELIALPALLKLSGRSDAMLTRAQLSLAQDFPKASPNRRFIRARAQGGQVFLPSAEHSSGSLSGMIGCNCLVDIPAGQGALCAGDLVEVVYFV